MQSASHAQCCETDKDWHILCFYLMMASSSRLVVVNDPVPLRKGAIQDVWTRVVDVVESRTQVLEEVHTRKLNTTVPVEARPNTSLYTQ